VIIISETWREESSEFFETTGGHLFLGSGGFSHKWGVAFLLHKRHAKSVKNFRAISERLACVSVTINQMRFRFVAAYFPHGGYGDAQVQQIYTTLSGLRKEAGKKQERFVVGGDFNAVVGHRTDHDNPANVGMHGLGEENSRGQWLKQWCCLENMLIANTFFPKHPDSKFTHVSTNGNRRQIDFVIIDKPLQRKLMDSSSDNSIDMGWDHRTVYALLALRDLKRRKRNH